MPMFPRSRRARAAVAATAVAVVVGLTPSVVTGPADAVDGAFAPQLITVDTPTRGDKEKLQRLGLDLTEHAGHDYIEVVLHTPTDLGALRDSNLTLSLIHISEPTRRTPISYAVFCLKKK